MKTTITVDKILVAVGRVPNTSDIGIQNTKIQLDTHGYIKVNEFQQTSDKHLYAQVIVSEHYN